MAVPKDGLMNNLFQFLKRRLLTAILLFVGALFSTEVAAQCESPTLRFHSPLLLSGTAGDEGAIYLFQQVIPGVDAHIEIVGIFGGATLYNIDDSTGIGYYDAFQPYVGAAPNDTSYIDWKISFKVSGTNTDTMLACLAVTGVDVDGDGAYLREFIEAATPGSIAIDPFSILNVSFDGVRSKAVSTIYNIPLIDTAHHEAMFQMNFQNISTLLYRNGAISTYGSQQIRQTCIYFKPFFQEFYLLPAKILSFTGRRDGAFNQINWTATTEDDVRDYILQKSLNGTDWKDLRIVMSIGSATVNNYSVIDPEKNIGDTYYRLKQMNTKVGFVYSKIIRINSANSTPQNITHNTLVKNTVTLQIYGTTREDYTIEQYTITGSKIKQDRVEIYPGINSLAVEFSSRALPGTYVLVIKNNKGQKIYSSRVIKN